jgi:hypothetical protein
MKRALSGVLVSLSLMLLGIVCGGLVSSFVVRPEDGLAGGATAALFAFAGMIAGLMVGLVLSRRLPADQLSRATAAASLLAAIAVGFTIWRGVAQRADRDEAVRKTNIVLSPDARPMPPTLPANGTPDSLLGLLVLPPDSLPRYETREVEYEVAAVSVYGQAGDYYLVGLRDGGREWLPARSAGAYYPMEQVILNRLNYLTEAWDRQVRDTPDLAAQARQVTLPPQPDPEIPAKVLEARLAGGTLWVHVEVHNQSPCEGETPKVVTTGWVPAWGAKRAPTVWFFSRGC